MTIVTVTNEVNREDAEFFRARVNGHHAVGRTAGEALDGLREHLASEVGSTIVLVQRLGGDSYFGADQIRRLGELMSRSRQARDAGMSLPLNEQTELESLIQAEFDASARRSANLADHLPE